MDVLREFERDLIVERTVAGIEAAKARGVTRRPSSQHVTRAGPARKDTG